MNANRMWHLIAELVSTYAEEGDLDKAMDTLRQALTNEPMWVANALFDARTARLRDRPDFKELTAIDAADGPAHFNASLVALEYGKLEKAYQLLARTFTLAQADGSLPFLLEALAADEVAKPYLQHTKFAALLDEYASA